ncbi:PEPxxWA-CTERM sorting domain-containing protein [Phenylobacterium sp.]|uniref:PEPxxWA-CTERM sorting domain-containing protein n=1 Tax=Phenylobacterium sp. TaxID=1871053 RepID=UPI0037C50897
MVRFSRFVVLTGVISILGLSAGASQAADVYQGVPGLAAFNAAAGSPPIAISFDALSGNIAGSTISGVTFSSPDGNTLNVVSGASTFTPGGFGGVIDASTNFLEPTSGGFLLSPGGSELVPGPALGQKDGLQLVFATPLQAFGLDILHQSFDCCTFADYTIFNSGGGIIASGGIIGGSGGGGAPHGSSFFGVYSAAGDIKRIVFNDTDDNGEFPDANLGYDSFRFGAAVPEPATWAMMIVGFGFAGGALRRRRILALGA